MGTRYLQSALAGAIWGAAFGWLGLGDRILTSASAGLIWALAIEWLAARADAQGGKPITYNRYGTYGVLAALILSVVLSRSMWPELGLLGNIIPLFLLLPILLWIWRPHWVVADETQPLSRLLGEQNLLPKLLAGGAVVGVVLGIWAGERAGMSLMHWLGRHVIGVTAWVAFGLLIGSFIWMDSDEARRRRDS